MVSANSICILQYNILSLFTGKICNKDGNALPPNSPPPPPDSSPQHGPNDWFPYELHIKFELADFIYRHNQMSEGNTDFLFNFINVVLASHSECASFYNHSNMHNTINATMLGEAPWDHFTLKYDGPLPEVPLGRLGLDEWQKNMKSGFTIWSCYWKTCLWILTSRMS